MHVPKPVIVAVLVVCGLVGVGVATAAVGPDEDESGTPSVATSAVTTSTTAAPSTSEAPATTQVPATTAVPDTTGPGAPDDDDGGGGSSVARHYGPECGAEIPGGTHGDYVSRTAHEGGDVPAMAQSDCGKPVTSVHDGPPAPAAPENEGGGGGDHPHGGPPGQAKDKPAKS